MMNASTTLSTRIIKNIFHVGAHLCVRPGRHAGLPLRLILCVFFITGLTACKVDFSIFGSGTVQSASPSIDCVGTGTYDGNGNPIMTGDCTQTYNVDENNVACSGANCTVVTDTITETYTATPVQDDTFDGFAGHCTGAGPCVKEITESEANVDQLVTAEVHFDPEAVPQDATYTYNYLGQRASKTVNSVTTYYIYDEQGNMLSEIDSSGNSIKDYIYMDGEYIAHVEQTGDTGNSETQEQLFYPLNDHLGQSFMVMRADEKFSHEQYTTPFGQMHAQFVDANVGTGPLKQNRRFPGQYYDAETGYSQNFNRDYDPSLGIYLEPDLLDNLSRTIDPQLRMAKAMGLVRLPRGGHFNLTYAYTEGDPVNRIDPSGLVTSNGNVVGGAGDQDWICSGIGSYMQKYFDNNLNNKPCVKKCCKEHDKCYLQRRCNATSWIRLVTMSDGSCEGCNIVVAQCVIDNWDNTSDCCK